MKKVLRFFPLVVLVLCLLQLIACGGNTTVTIGPLTDSSAATPRVTPDTAPTPTGKRIYPIAEGMLCYRDFENPSEDPLNHVECGGDKLTLAQGGDDRAEFDLKLDTATGLADYILLATVDLGQSSETYAGFLLGGSNGVYVVVNRQSDWRIIQASALGTVTSAEMLAHHNLKQNISTVKVAILRSADGSYAVYADGEKIFPQPDDDPIVIPIGQFGFCALAPTGRQDIAHVIVFSDIAVYAA